MLHIIPSQCQATLNTIRVILGASEYNNIYQTAIESTLNLESGSVRLPSRLQNPARVVCRFLILGQYLL
jgi:hypothetical protein